MIKRYPPISSKLAVFMHGADYNPDQWQHSPEILDEDIRLMKLAKCNVMAIGIFAWHALEPEEGIYSYEWLDRILDRFQENGIYAWLATPSGARPAWMSEKYPEVLRVGGNRVRNLHGARHNHCYTSPVYREKTLLINRKLAERYGQHPAVIGWHISNEFGGECHCDLCQEAFRGWLKRKYGSLEALNLTWWTSFWSHTYTSWSQVESPAPHGETGVHGHNLDWKRFVTDQTVDFCRHEIAPLKELSPNLPVTTNMMDLFEGLDYWKFADVLDVISWDAYPTWHDNKEGEDLSKVAAWFSFNHDLFRSIKGGQPFMLMESTPSLTNWQPVSKLKRPGMHKLSSLQAVAHGADTVQYFQWRKSRGSSEKFHGAVVDHCGHEHTRVFQDVSALGQSLECISEIIGTTVDAKIAIIFDWDNRWAVKDSQGPRNSGIHYEETVMEHYKALWELGVSVDIINSNSKYSTYNIIIAPMLYMVTTDVGKRIEQFVDSGGTLVTTYWSGIVDDNDLCHLGGFPGPLRKVLGIRSEEIDALHDGETNQLVYLGESLQPSYMVYELCDLIHTEGAEVLAVYGEDFYVGRPALTLNTFGKGKAYYIAARAHASFYDDFYTNLVSDCNIPLAITSPLPKGVTAQVRTDGDSKFVFLLNFSGREHYIRLNHHAYTDMETNKFIEEGITLPIHGSCILRW
jgi:beta-galactosidase